MVSFSSHRLWRWTGWKPLLIALGLLSVGLPAFFYWYDPKPPPPALDAPIGKVSIRLPPLPPGVRPYRIAKGLENEIAVWRIQVVEDGDELIVDAVSGRLIAVRDKDGKTTWRPMVATKQQPELPMKS
jgi:hypothetical protein